jgi:secreted trypsin-like serine protease
MPRRLLVAALALVVLLAGALPAAAITFGQPDDGANPNVGLIVIAYDLEGQAGGPHFGSCSGTLIAPTVLLTAGHCIGERHWVTFEEDDVLRGLEQDADLLDYLERAEHFLETTAGVTHPQYADYAGFPDTYDLGVIHLAAPVEIAPAELPEVGLLDGLRGRDKSGFTVAGYGMQGVVPAFSSDELARHKGEVRLVQLRSRYAGGHTATFTNNPGQGNGAGGVCFGDSGGPVLRGDTIVAVTAWGMTPCIGVDFQFRVDTELALDFIRAELERHPTADQLAR